MPYKDPGKMRDYQREYQRMRRSGDNLTPGKTLIDMMPFKMRTAQDILSLLGEQVAAVRSDKQAGTLERARCIGYLAGIALKAVEVSDLEGRLSALEQILKGRKLA
jgi:hypothetical protein